MLPTVRHGNCFFNQSDNNYFDIVVWITKRSKHYSLQSKTVRLTQAQNITKQNKQQTKQFVYYN